MLETLLNFNENINMEIIKQTINKESVDLVLKEEAEAAISTLQSEKERVLTILQRCVVIMEEATEKVKSEITKL